MLKKLVGRIAKTPERVNDFYVTGAPGNQHIVDLFKGEWSATMPGEAACASSPGLNALFDDPRMKWAEEVLGGFKGADILELGPLEAHHSYMLHKAGAKSVTAIEANSRAFLKCLCVKEMLGLANVRFLLGDFVEFLQSNTHIYDAVIANGVLYHMARPMEFLELLGKTADKIVLWTHYYDEAIITANRKLAPKFGRPVTFEYKGFSYQSAKQHYKRSLGWAGFCGGMHATSTWLSRQSILDHLKHMGFEDIRINFENTEHPNGPSFNICAMRS